MKQNKRTRYFYKYTCSDFLLIFVSIGMHAKNIIILHNWGFLCIRDAAGIHICSPLVVEDDYNLVRTTEVTLKVVLWMSKVLLNHKILVFSKIPN